jgi:hypothetical protein
MSKVPIRRERIMIYSRRIFSALFMSAGLLFQLSADVTTTALSGKLLRLEPTD